MKNKNIITKDGLQDLKLELKKLINEERPIVIAAIKEARALGDLSENADFDAAREKQGQIEDRIQEIQSIVDNSSLINVKKSMSNKVIIGSTVDFFEIDTKQKKSIQLVGSLEADPFQNKISNSSPLGASILGSQVGETIVVQVGNKYKIKIEKITN